MVYIYLIPKIIMKNCALSLLLALSLICTRAISQSPAKTKLSLNHIAMYVHELKRSTAFYEEILMLQKIEEPFKDGKHTWFTLGPAGHLHLIQGAPADIPRDKNDHLCFSVNSIEDFIANLDKHHIEYTNWPGTAKAPTVRVDGVKQVYFQDPDGHWIEVNNDR
jgi:lactoylglutathione lyase